MSSSFIFDIFQMAFAVNKIIYFKEMLFFWTSFIHQWILKLNVINKHNLCEKATARDLKNI